MTKNMKNKMIPALLAITLSSSAFLPALYAADPIIKIDGSSTVYPITEAVAEELQAVDRKTKVIVGISGTGGGFKKFCAGEIDIANASRPITAKEIALCAENKIEWMEIGIAYDGLAVVVNPKNNWVSAITIAELKKIWEPAAQEKIKQWSPVRSGWPKKEIHLFGPGADSGTFDFFTEVVVGKAKSSRGDFTASEDDNVLVQGISTDLSALGYFGLGYYEENKKRVKLVAVDAGNGPIFPSLKTVGDGTYPLSRPLFIYVSSKSLKKPEVNRFIAFYLENAPELSREVGYIPFPKEVQSAVDMRFNQRVAGSLYTGDGSVGKSFVSLLRGGK
ncbi:MAG: PstS family phosphate ABC transporter substrate-binding protein [Nitrospirota bacterium]